MKVDHIAYSYAHLKSVEMHKHSYWEIVIFLEGTGVHTVGNKRIEFRENTIVCQPPNILHGTKADNEYRDMYIVVEDFVSPFPEKIPVFTDDEENRYRILADMMHSTFYRKEPNYNHTAQAIFQAMYQMMVGWSVKKAKSGSIDYAVSELISNFSNPNYTASSLVHNSNYSSDHFRRVFKKETGKTPTAYLIDLRVENAKKLLRQREQANYMIKDIAFLSGFSDQYYFSRLFKEKTGISPVDFA